MLPRSVQERVLRPYYLGLYTGEGVGTKLPRSVQERVLRPGLFRGGCWDHVI